MGFVELPLGIDVGSERVRVARMQRAKSGEARLCAVAARDFGLPPGDAMGPKLEAVAAVVEDLRREIGGRQWRCVAALDARAAAITRVQFPPMPMRELRRAARFEAERAAPAAIAAAATVVRLRRTSAAGDYTVGIVRTDALRDRTACLRRAGLRPIAVDYDALAFRRAFPSCDAAIDAGSHAVRLHVYAAANVRSWSVLGGGSEMTRAIAADLAIELSEAERRKRSIGLAGAGEAALADLVRGLNEALAHARERAPVRRIVLVGNAARLPGLRRTLQERLEAGVEIGASALLFGGAYPADVARAGAPDWTLAAALACWGSPA